MNNNFFDILQDNLKTLDVLTDSSKKVYSGYIKKLSKNVIISIEDDSKKIYESLIKTINDKFVNNEQRKNVLVAMNAMIKHNLNDTYKSLFNELYKLTNDKLISYTREINNHRLFRKPSSKELQQFNNLDGLDYKSFLKIKRSFIDPSNLNDYLLLTLYMYRPLRIEEYKNMIIINVESDEYVLTDPTINIYSIPEKTLYVNKYKTQKTHGQRKILFDNETNDEIFKLYNKNFERLTNANNLKDLIHMQRPVQSLRAIFVSEFLKKQPKGSEIIQMAYELGHNPSTMMQLYNKYNIIADIEYLDIYL